MSSGSVDWANRVVRVAWMDPAALLPNPHNWRAHPPEQIALMEAALQEIGFTSPVVWNLDTERLIDGHMRTAITVNKGFPRIRVLQVSVPEHLEPKAVQSHDLITALADADSTKLIALTKSLSFQMQELAQFFAPQLEQQLAAIDRDLLEPAPPKKPRVKPMAKLAAPEPVTPERPDTFVVSVQLTDAQRSLFYAAVNQERGRAEQTGTYLSTTGAVVALCDRYLAARGVRIAHD